MGEGLVGQRGSLERALLAMVAGGQVLVGALLLLPMASATGEAMHHAAFMLGFLFPAAYLASTARRGLQPASAWYLMALGFALLASSRWPVLRDPDALNASGDGRASGIWLAGLVCMLLAVATLAGSITGHRSRASFVDALLVALGAFALLSSILATQLPGHGGEQGAWSVGNVALFFDLLLISMTLGGLSGLRRPPQSVWLLLTASLLFATADIAAAVLDAHGSTVLHGVVDLVATVSAALVALAWYRRTGKVLASAVEPLPRIAVPALMLLAAGAVLLLPRTGQLDTAAQGAAFLAIALAALRMRLAVRSTIKVSAELRASAADPHTTLPNRTALRDLAGDRVQGATLVIVDLDGFGDINAEFGWTTADEVLLRVADRLAISLAPRDILARVGHDEFGLLLAETDVATAMRRAEALVAGLEEEMRIDGQLLQLSACAGVSAQAMDADVVRLMREAEQALRQAQQAGTGIVRSFAGNAGDRSQARLHLRARLREVLRGDGSDFVPHVQPIVSPCDGTLFAVEALARWQDGEALRSPAEFLDEIANVDGVGAFTSIMLRRSLQSMRDAGLAAPVCVNVSPASFDPALPALVAQALAHTGSTPGQLIIEVTEDAIMRDPAVAADVLAGLRAAGVRVLLDDFGTGWSGLSTLRDLSVDGLKLDGSFVRGMQEDPTTLAIVESVVQLAERLGLLVVYEGIEDPVQLQGLRSDAGALVQGFAVARPMPVAEFAVWSATPHPVSGSAG